MKKKISLIGAGQIGGTLAHLISIEELANVVLFDVVESMAKGKALDIAQSTSINGSNISLIGTSNYEDIKNSDVPPKVIEFLAHKITSNVRELEGAFKRLVAHSQLVGRPITLESTQDVLHDLLRANDRKVTIEEIQRVVKAIG